MLNRIRALIDRWRQIQSLEALTERDLADLGMTRDQVRDFILMPPDVPDRVARMAAIFAIPDADLKAHHADYLEILGSCAHCTDRAACSVVLRNADVTRPQDAAFCPNADHFAALHGAAA